MNETRQRSLTNSGTWMLILAPTYSVKIFIGQTIMTTYVIPFVIGMLLARDSIVGIIIPSSISLPASLYTRSVIHHLETNSLVVCFQAYDVYYREGPGYLCETRSDKSYSWSMPTQQTPSEIPVEHLYDHLVTLWRLIAHKVFLWYPGVA